MRRNKIITAILMISVLFSNSIVTDAKNISNKIVKETGVTYEKSNTRSGNANYIVHSVNKIKINNIMDSSTCEDSDTSGMLSENNIAVVNLNEYEADKLKNDGIVVEKDDYVEGCGNYAKRLKKKRLAGKLKPYKIKEDTTDYDWNIKMIGLNEDCVINNSTKKRIKIAIIDSGIDYCSNINVVERKNFIPNDEVSVLYEDNTGHGTAIAGIIASDGKEGTILGINPDVDIYSARVLDSNNKAPISRIVEAVYWAIDKKVNIINLSLGTQYDSSILHEALSDAEKAGILVFAATGNDGKKDSVEYPAAYNEIVAVGAVNPEGDVSELSSEGEEVELYAPGEAVRSVGWLESEVTCSGTSISVAHAVGACSLLWQKNPDKPADFIRGLMASSAKDVNGDGYGLIDVEYANKIYDEYSAEYKIGEDIDKYAKHYDNNGDIDTDENIIAKWSTSNHQNCVTGTANYVEIMKYAVKWADGDDNLGHMTKNPWFHGYFNEENVYKTNVKTYNYITACELLSELAFHKGNVSKICNKQYYSDIGLSAAAYDEITGHFYGNGSGIKDNNGHLRSWSSILMGHGGETDFNKKYFIYGLVLHTATDALAHSTCKSNGNRIKHVDNNGNGVDDADDITYYPNRWNDAKELAKYIMDYAVKNSYTVCSDAFMAPSYKDHSRSYKIANIAYYAAKDYNDIENLQTYNNYFANVNYLWSN